MTDILPNGRGSHFRLVCEAGYAGALRVPADRATITIAQRVNLAGDYQFSESVQVSCQRESDGSLTVQVVIHEGDNALQIAVARSRPYDAVPNDPSVKCDLTHKTI